jgi:hypothetical protein
MCLEEIFSPDIEVKNLALGGALPWLFSSASGLVLSAMGSRFNAIQLTSGQPLIDTVTGAV